MQNKPHENPSESLLLARMRTLLALERNHMAEKRTILAQFRTGLALILITPPSGIIFFSDQLSLSLPLWAMIGFLISFGLVIVVGIVMLFQARLRLRKINQEILNLKPHMRKIIDENPIIANLLSDCMERYC